MKESPLRVLVIASEVPPVTSGLARSVGAIISGLAERGHEVHTLSSADAKGLKWDRLRISMLARHLSRILRESGPFDVVNVHGPSPSVSDVAMVQLARRGNPPVVYTHHFSVHFAIPVVDQAAALYDSLTRRLARRCAAVVTTTPSYATQFGRHRVSVIPWAVDSCEYHCDPTVARYDGSRPLRVLCVGQFRRYKGFDVAVRALAGVAEVELSLVGRGPRLENVIAQANGASNVRYLGTLDDEALAAAYREHDVILLPSTSRLEAFGLVLLEGMSSGCVPVASRLLGITDVVGNVGLTTIPGDAADLRHQLVRLARDPDEVNERSKLALQAARQYRWDSTLDAYEALFRRVVSEDTPA